MARSSRRVVVDSDVLIKVLRGDENVASNLRHAVAEHPVAITPISVAEVLVGARPRDEARTRELLGAFDCLRIDRAVGELAATFARRFGASHGVEIADAFVAACAAHYGYRLWTLNRKHYPMREIRFFRT